ncbi:MAG: hypothetical protein HC802_16355 [Caldilineaceae bacterium]|nr:hypothetical protein [Caldilineaceae bacterium]
MPAGNGAQELYRRIHAASHLIAGGLHVYDGHLHDPDPVQRALKCDQAMEPVFALLARLKDAGLPVPRLVAGGTPTFPFHARRDGVECSPGTCVFWDAGYGSKLKDLDFLHGALVLTRVVSKPLPNQLCLDLGHKAVASENPHPRVLFPQLPDAEAISHSEEHLVVQTSRADAFQVGDALYGIPWHICPTVALHAEAVVIRDGQASGVWTIPARERRLAI